MTDKQFTSILSPVQKLSNLSASVEEKVTMMYEISVESIRYNENQASELKAQTSILKDIRNILSGGIIGSKSKAKKEEEVKGPKPSSFAGLDKLNKDTIGIAALAMVGIAAAIVAAAGIFTFIPIVSGAQLLTALAISVAFIPMSLAFVQISNVLSKIKGGDEAKNAKRVGLDGKGVFMLMGSSLLAMVGMSAAVTLSSLVMQFIVPVSMAKVGTAFFIGLAMVGLAYGYAQVVKALASVKEKRTGRINTGDLFSMVGGALLSMVGMAAAVTVSSWIMQLIVPVSIAQVGTAFFIGLAMVGLSYGYAQVVKALASVKEKRTGRVNTGDLFSVIGGALLAMVGMAAAVTLSSWIMQLIVPVSMEQLGTVFAISIVMIGAAFAYGLILRSIKNLNIKDLLVAATAIPLIAIGLTASAWIFTFLPDTFKVPPSEWSLKSGLALAIFGLAFVVLAKTVAKLPLKDLLMGVVGMAAIAVGILAVAWIFSILPDTYNELPMGWVLGTVAALIGFGGVVGTIGAIIMASGGTGIAAIALGVVGMIIIAAGILAVAWILSYIPADKLSSVAKGLTSALLAPVNGIIDILARLKNEIGVENLIPLAGGILAISGSLIALAASVAGVAVAGLGASLANAASSFVDWLSKSEKQGPMEILEKLVGMHDKILTLSKALQPMASSFASLTRLATLDNIQNLNNMVQAIVLKDSDMSTFNGYTVSKYFDKYPKFLNSVAVGFRNIAKAQSSMDLDLLSKTTEMIKALAYLNEFGGDTAMEKLGDALINAVKELSAMIQSFAGSVDAQTVSGKEQSGVLSSIMSTLSNFASSFNSGGGSRTSPSTVNVVNMDEVVDAIEELQRIMRRNNNLS